MKIQCWVQIFILILVGIVFIFGTDVRITKKEFLLLAISECSSGSSLGVSGIVNLFFWDFPSSSIVGYIVVLSSYCQAKECCLQIFVQCCGMAGEMSGTIQYMHCCYGIQ